jgi:hypothetical protein
MDARNCAFAIGATSKSSAIVSHPAQPVLFKPLRMSVALWCMIFVVASVRCIDPP